jgi:uncharacterized protein (DUF1810 family)
MSDNDEFAQFIAAQAPVYERVLAELRIGRKATHWMWFIFPQLAGLGTSHMAQKFALASVAAASRYLAHTVLGPRLRECTDLMLACPQTDVSAILGYPDDLKFRSSMTLFDQAPRAETRFRAALDKFFGGERDPLTMQILADQEGE